MATKAVFVLCVSAVLVQCTLGQCHSRVVEPLAPCRGGLAYDGLAYSPALNGRVGCVGGPAVDISIASSLNAAHGGGLSVTSSSCSAPTGLAVASENVYEGPVAVAGKLPFLGTAAMEGVFPTAGASSVSYGCGDGVVAITAEGPVEAAFAPVDLAPAVVTPAAIAPAAIAPAAIVPAAIAPAMTYGYRGLPSRGCGCGSMSAY